MVAERYYEINTPDSLAKMHLSDIRDKHVSIPDNFPVSKGVTYGMSEWQLKDLLNERHYTVNDAKTMIAWNKYILPPVIIDDLKRLALLCLFSGICSSPGSKRKKAMKPNTVAARVKSLGKFFSKIYEQSVLIKCGNREVSVIKKLSDISYEMMVKEAEKYPESGVPILIGLKQIGKCEVRLFLNSEPNKYNWTIQDISNISFGKGTKDRKTNGAWKSRTLPNALFRFVTKKAVTDVATATVASGLELHDRSAESMVDHKILGIFRNANVMTEDYIKIRKLDIKRSLASSREKHPNGSKISNRTGVERKEFKVTHGVSAQEFYNWWTMVRTSAQILILQYIGFRHSESLSLKFDHALPKNKALISKTGNVWTVKGTVIKHKASSLPVSQDEWVAIPIVRDAIAVLEFFNDILGKSYVFSSSQMRGTSKNHGKSYDRESSDKPYSPTGFRQAINKWKKKKDIKGDWSHWDFNIQQFRHSIANQLARAELGLEFITYQMKHMVQALSDMPSEVTLGYGGVGEAMQESALRDAKEEAVRSLFHPNNPVAGGMADEFKESRITHFKGAMASGMNEEEYFSMLAEQGIPFINVGGGYCSGRKYVQYSDGSKSKAPCVGSYECSPNKCANAIVTQSHIPVWVDMYNSNKRNSRDPELFYARESFEEKAKDAKEVLELLNVSIKEL